MPDPFAEFFVVLMLASPVAGLVAMLVVAFIPNWRECLVAMVLTATAAGALGAVLGGGGPMSGGGWGTLGALLLALGYGGAGCTLALGASMVSRGVGWGVVLVIFGALVPLSHLIVTFRPGD